MIEVKGNIWDYKKADFICITTNGDVNRKNEAVMGRGVALQAKQRYKHIATILASHITLYGNHVSLIIESEVYNNIISFPVKHHWYEKANLDLIRISAIELLVLIKKYNSDIIFVLPKPGCGNGQLKWEEVKSVISFLPDNVHIIDL